MADWFTFDSDDAAVIDRLVLEWPDAPLDRPETCGMLLEVAREQIIAFAPVLDEDATIPARYVYAQLQQAINLWNAGRVSSGGDVGVDGFMFVPRPLDKTIRTAIRPVDGKPDVY